jgi:hypothetical protein
LKKQAGGDEAVAKLKENGLKSVFLFLKPLVRVIEQAHYKKFTAKARKANEGKTPDGRLKASSPLAP